MQAALREGAPVVALETTLVSHGFPGRQGVEVALAAEERVRGAGAVPATIGIVDGVLRAGLTEAELDRFAAAGESARKAGPATWLPAWCRARWAPPRWAERWRCAA